MEKNIVLKLNGGTMIDFPIFPKYLIIRMHHFLMKTFKVIFLGSFF